MRDRLFVRSVVLACCLLIGSVMIARASRTEASVPRDSFASFPTEVGAWRGRAAGPLGDRVLAVLGVDEYVNRVYSAPDGSAVGLYIGYYRTQSEGDTMHSPLNCLPGAGWEPVVRRRLALGGDKALVNRLTIQKGLDRQVVLYWYQSHGRVVASEYWGKVYTVLDAIRLGRTDAAMVRIIAPVDGPGTGAEEAAERQAVEFGRTVFPLLSRYVPQ